MKIITEIHPYGYSENAKVIREIYIGNMMTRNSKDKVLYHVWLNDPRENSPRLPPDCKVWHSRDDGDLVLAGLVATKLGKMVNNLQKYPAMEEALSAWSKKLDQKQRLGSVE